MKSSQRFNERYFKKLSFRVILLLLLFIGSLALFVYITRQVLWDKEEGVDRRVFDVINTHVHHPDLTPFMEAVTWCASSTFLQIGYGLLVVFYLLKRNWKRAVEIGVIGIGGYAINYAMKLSFQRVRPPDPIIEPLHNFSFPSGHATSAFIFYGLLTYLVWKTPLARGWKLALGALLISFAFLIGFSRIYLRLHYTSDVVAGFCIGFARLALAKWIMERTKKQSDTEMRGTTGQRQAATGNNAAV